MRTGKLSLRLTLLLAVLALTIVVGASGVAQEESVLHSFNEEDGANPAYENLVFDAAGNLYGTAYNGGAHGFGAVFELTPKVGGGWTEHVLHSFNATGNSPKDGAEPSGALVFDAYGSLYGTTLGGGIYNSGTVFKLTPKADGTWTERVVHYFRHDGTDGTEPASGLILDPSHNLYGTTHYGGSGTCVDRTGYVIGCGTVFELLPRAGGGMSEKIVHSFSGQDGVYPFDGLIFDSAGKLYGTTLNGGGGCALAEACGGTVFELKRDKDGGWYEKVLHNFGNRTDFTVPISPAGTLALDKAGNLYGATSGGGAYGFGTAFKLMHTGEGRWVLKILYDFNWAGSDGPPARLILDAAGNLYGTSAYSPKGYGSVFELMPSSTGRWKKIVLHRFENVADGRTPSGGVTLGPTGSLCGATEFGGAYGAGTVFEITP